MDWQEGVPVVILAVLGPELHVVGQDLHLEEAALQHKLPSSLGCLGLLEVPQVLPEPLRLMMKQILQCSA